MIGRKIKSSDHLLIIAVQSENVEDVQKLLNSHQHLLGIPDNYGDTALHCAAFNGLSEMQNSYLHSSQIFQMLLSAAVNSKVNNALLNQVNNKGDTPLTRALKRSETIDDIFVQRAVAMIQYGARLPNTSYAKSVFDKLSPEIKTLIQEKINAATSPLPNQPPTSPETNRPHQNTLIQYASGGQSFSGLRHRHVTNADKNEFEMKPM